MAQSYRHCCSIVEHVGSRPQPEMSRVIPKSVVFHLTHNYIVLFYISEQNRTYTNLVSSVMLIYCEVQLFFNPD